MKKVLLFFAMVFAACTAFAETKDVTFDIGVTKGISYTGEDGSPVAGHQVVTLDGVTIESDIDAIWSSQYRFYKNSVNTFSTAKGEIVKIEFTCTAAGTANYGPGNFTAEDGEYTYEDKVGTWTGSAASVTLTAATNQVRATKVVVTVDLGDAPAAVQVLSADDVVATSSYYIYTDARGGLTLDDANATTLRGTSEPNKEAQEVDGTNPLQQFAFINWEGELYLYSVGAGKFVNKAKTGKLEDTPEDPVYFRFADESTVVMYYDDSFNFNLGGSKQVTIDTWGAVESKKDAGNSWKIMPAAAFDPTPIIAALEDAKNSSTDITYKYMVDGKLWKTVTSTQKKGETVAAPEAQDFANILGYDEEAVVAEGLEVIVNCEENLPFEVTTDMTAPVYGYLRGHSNQIRYIYVDENGMGKDERVNEEKTEFEDNYVWCITGNLVDGFELYNLKHGVLRAAEGQTSVNGEASSVWQLRPGTAGSALTENFFALWQEDVTYLNCQGDLKYWDDNDQGSTFVFVVLSPEQIVSVESVATETTVAPLFDLTGRRVAAPVKGQLYIQNRRKMIF